MYGTRGASDVRTCQMWGTMMLGNRVRWLLVIGIAAGLLAPYPAGVSGANAMC